MKGDNAVQSIIHDPRIVAACSLGQGALVAGARTDTLPSLAALAEQQPLAVAVSVIGLAGMSFLLSQVSSQAALRLRRGVLALIAISLSVIAMDFLNVVQADRRPWDLLLYGMTALVLVGGLAGLIVKPNTRRELR